MKSKCCNAPVTIEGEEGETRYWVCDKCGKPCDAYAEYAPDKYWKKKL